MTRFAVLTGDLIDSTALDSAALDAAFEALGGAAATLESWQGCPARFTRYRGDGWQVAVARPEQALRVALLSRAALRRLGKRFATRVALAEGEGDLGNGPDLSGARGPVFSASGRALDALDGPATMVHAAGGPLAAATRLADAISQGWTEAQAAALTLMLPPDPPTRAAAADVLGISRQAVDQSLAAASWPAIEAALLAIEGEA